MDPFQHVHFSAFHSAMKRPSLADRVRKMFKRKVTSGQKRESSDLGEYSPCDSTSKAGEYRAVLGSPSTMAVFRNGTCVFSHKQLTKDEAVDLMKTEGAVVYGTCKADFYVGKIKEPIPGTVIRYHHPNIVSFVNEREYPLDSPEHAVGAFVRLAREFDSRDLRVVHYESKPSTL